MNKFFLFVLLICSTGTQPPLCQNGADKSFQSYCAKHPPTCPKDIKNVSWCSEPTGQACDYFK